MPDSPGISDAARYRRDGALFPIRVFWASQAAEHRQRLEAAEAEHGKFHYLTKPYLIFGSAAEIARHPALLDAVEAVLGPDILLWDSAYIIKEAGDDRFVSWHQDLTYWGLDSDAQVTAWVALTPSNRGTGCMRFLPGSHHEGRLAHEDTHAEGNLLHRGQDASAALPDGQDPVDIELAPGEASLHHGWVLHASGPNPSGERRIGLSVQYVAPSVRQTVTDQESATLVRGTDRFGHFRPEPGSKADFDPEALAFQKRAERLKRWVYDRA